MIQDGLKQFINKNRKYCIIKLSPKTDLKLIDSFYKQGFRQFHCCNTVPIPEGGLSGSAIKYYSRNLICYIRDKYPECEIIAGGGIHTKTDVEEFRSFGSNHFAFSTLMFHPWKFFKFYVSCLSSKN